MNGIPHGVYSATLQIRTISRSVPKDILSDAGVAKLSSSKRKQAYFNKAAHGLDIAGASRERNSTVDNANSGAQSADQARSFYHVALSKIPAGTRCDTMKKAYVRKENSWLQLLDL